MTSLCASINALRMTVLMLKNIFTVFMGITLDEFFCSFNKIPITSEIDKQNNFQNLFCFAFGTRE